MSLDIWLENKPCELCGRTDECFSANYTHNVTPMWSLAGCYEALYESAGQTAAEILPAIESAVEKMQADPESYIALNSSNGWGTYDTALPWLIELRDACRANPDAVVRIWK